MLTPNDALSIKKSTLCPAVATLDGRYHNKEFFSFSGFLIHYWGL